MTENYHNLLGNLFRDVSSLNFLTESDDDDDGITCC